MRILAIAPAILIAAALSACDSGPKKPPVPQPRIEGQAVVFPAGSPQVAALISEKIEARKEAVLRFNGRLVWDEDRTVRVSSPFGGRVLKIDVRLGDPVRKGQTLAVIAAPELGVAQSEARKAEQDDALAQKNLTRVAELYGAGVAPAKDLQASEAEAARAAAERARTVARLKLYGAAAGAVDQRFALGAPIDGVVVERNLNPGQELRAENQGDKGLFVISDPQRLWFVLDVAEGDAGAVKPGTEVQLGATMLGEDTVTGKITNVADFVDPQTRTVKVRGTVENPGRRVKAEMFVTAELKVPAARGFIVPAKAVFLRGEQNYVFVDAGDGRFVRKPVRLGPATADGHQVVLEGLAADEKVVTEGGLLLERMLTAKE
ncbi:MAG TPA: efflux RND transporter periplasmic adaptor subunit [Burkholderiales bacterium]|jgi:cobalt-zinc-cadmium efflux system membrane fusion protein|nr:efflux RND transporter periplasmic adaptor subunit [Burkholderiales bacterium]